MSKSNYIVLFNNSVTELCDKIYELLKRDKNIDPKIEIAREIIFNYSKDEKNDFLISKFIIEVTNNNEYRKKIESNDENFFIEEFRKKKNQETNEEICFIADILTEDKWNDLKEDEKNEIKEFFKLLLEISICYSKLLLKDLKMKKT